MADELEFEMPKGFTPPERLDSDDTFQAMATFKLVDDSTLRLVDVEGYPIAEGEEEEGEEEGAGAERAEAANAAAALQAAGAGGQQGPQPGPGLAPGAGMAGAGPAGGAPPPPPPAGPAPGGLVQELGRRFRAATGRR